MTATEPARPALTISEAARATRLDRRTIRRRLDTDAFPNAYREGEGGPWRIPVGDLIAAGLHLYATEPATSTTPTPAPRIDTTELDRLRTENTELRRRAEVAEAIATERLHRAENAELALRAITAPGPAESGSAATGADSPATTPSDAPAANATPERRQGWVSRLRRHR